jgi:RHS repeat-associated protein
LFTQHERDAENSSDSALYRQYASTQGRWLAPDPYNGSYDLRDPQSLNRYAYVANRPLAATDPLGLGPWDSFLEFITAGLYDHDDNNGPKVSANVETTYGNPYLSANGTVVFPENVGVSYSTAGGVFRNLPLPDASFFFRVYSFAFSSTSPRVAATVAPNNGSSQPPPLPNLVQIQYEEYQQCVGEHPFGAPELSWPTRLNQFAPYRTPGPDFGSKGNGMGPDGPPLSFDSGSTFLSLSKVKACIRKFPLSPLGGDTILSVGDVF